MKLLIKILARIAFNTKPKIEEHMLIVMEKSTHEEYLCQPLKTSIKQFKFAVTFLTGYKGNFNVTNPNNKLCFAKSITDKDGFYHVTIPPGAL